MNNRSEHQSPTDRLTNSQVAAVALFLLGGASTRQHQEDVAVKCFELAPRRFGWQKYDYPDIDRTGIALRDGKKSENGVIIAGDKRIGWILTPDGVDWAKRQSLLSGDASANRTSVLTLRDDQELRMLTKHRLFRQWRRGSEYASRFEVADAIGLPADAEATAISRRIQQLEGAARAAQLSNVEGFLRWLKDGLRT